MSVDNISTEEMISNGVRRRKKNENRHRLKIDCEKEQQTNVCSFKSF